MNNGICDSCENKRYCFTTEKTRGEACKDYKKKDTKADYIDDRKQAVSWNNKF